LAQRRIEAGATQAPPSVPVSEYTPDVELLAAIVDRLGGVISTLVAVNGGKNPPKIKPWPRPVTAFERAKNRAAKAEFEDIVAKVLPHQRP
jgi:hypothetical protein